MFDLLLEIDSFASKYPKFKSDLLKLVKALPPHIGDSENKRLMESLKNYLSDNLEEIENLEFVISIRKSCQHLIPYKISGYLDSRTEINEVTFEKVQRPTLNQVEYLKHLIAF